MSTPYMPSNGTEGEFFMNDWCAKCHHNDGCNILAGSFAGIQPKEWVKDPLPKCTAFLDADNLPQPEPDPNQFAMFSTQ